MLGFIERKARKGLQWFWSENGTCLRLLSNISMSAKIKKFMTPHRSTGVSVERAFRWRRTAEAAASGFINDGVKNEYDDDHPSTSLQNPGWHLRAMMQRLSRPARMVA
jgi:hypothetical protein